MSSITLNYNNRTDTIDIYDITKNYPDQNVDINGYNLYQAVGFKKYEYDIMTLYNNTYDISASLSLLIKNNQNITIYIDNHLGEDISFSNINLTYFNYIEQYSYINRDTDNNNNIYNSLLLSNTLYNISAITDENTSNTYSIFYNKNGYDKLKLIKNGNHCLIIPFHSINKRIYKLLNNSYLNTLYYNNNVLDNALVFINSSFKSRYYEDINTIINNETIYSYKKQDKYQDQLDIDDTIKNYIDGRFNLTIDNDTITTVSSDKYMNIQHIDIENQVGTYIYSTDYSNNSTTSIELYGSINNNSYYKNNIIFKPNVDNNIKGKTIFQGKVETHKLNTTNIVTNNYLELYNYIDSIKFDCNFVNDDNELSITDINDNNNINMIVNDIYSNNITTDNIYPTVNEFINIGNESIKNNIYSNIVFCDNIINNNIFHVENRLIVLDSIKLTYPLNNNIYVSISAYNTTSLANRVTQLIEEDINYTFNTDDILLSDPRFKHNEVYIDPSFSINCIRNLHSYKYKYKKEKESDYYDYGFMADEVQHVIPDAVITEPTLIDIENISCEYSIVYNNINNVNELHIKNIHDDEFDIKCNFYMMSVECDFSYISIENINYDTSTCVLYTSNDLNYTGKYKTDYIREYIYAHKENIKIRLNNIEYNTHLIFDKNNDINYFTIDISNIPLELNTNDIEIYIPIKYITFEGNVKSKIKQSDNIFTNYTLQISDDIYNNIKNNNYNEMILYKVLIKDGKKINYRKLFMQYHGSLKFIETEQNDIYNKIDRIKEKISRIKQKISI